MLNFCNTPRQRPLLLSKKRFLLYVDYHFFTACGWKTDHLKNIHLEFMMCNITFLPTNTAYLILIDNNFNFHIEIAIKSHKKIIRNSCQRSNEQNDGYNIFLEFATANVSLKLCLYFKFEPRRACAWPR